MVGAGLAQLTGRLRRPDAPGDALAQTDAGASPLSQVETRLAGVVVAALREAFDRDRARMELERTHLDAERQRAEAALRAELARQAADRALGRIRVVAIMTIGVWMLSAALAVWLPGMRAGGYGRIINMTSVYGERGTTQRIDYVTSKAAIQGMTRAVAMEVAGSDVTCHALRPGSVLTPAIDGRVEALRAREGLSRRDAEVKFLAGKQPSGRFVETDSVCRALLLLCGPAGPDMNGAILPIEGGWLAS